MAFATAPAVANAPLAGLSSPGLSSTAMVGLILSSLDSDKAEEVVVIDLAGKSSMADALIIASGTSSRHVGSMADHILRRLKGAGAPSVVVEGRAAGDWVLIDAKDVVVHLFRPEVRRFYSLERLWETPASLLGTAAGQSAQAGP